jgi:hypothetical protein
MYYITPREDHSRHYDLICYDVREFDQLPQAIQRLWLIGQIKGDVFGKTLYVDRSCFGQLMRQRNYDAITLDSRRSLRYVKSYGALVNPHHPLYQDWMGA